MMPHPRRRPGNTTRTARSRPVLCVPHHTRVAGADSHGGASALAVTRREISRVVRLWGEPAGVGDAVTQVAGELLAAFAHARHVEIHLTRVAHVVRVTISAEHVPPVSPTDIAALCRVELVNALMSSVRIERFGDRRVCCVEVPATDLDTR